MKELIEKRIILFNKLRAIDYSEFTATNIINIKEQLKIQMLLEDYPITPPSTVTINVISDLKISDLKEDTIIKTKGYYEIDDGGAATYIIKDYNYYLNEWLPIDCKKVGIAPTTTDVKLINTPVDEWGNHTLSNGLIACLINKENITPEQYGCIGDNIFNNADPFIHLFAHMKKGKITFKENAIYLIAQRSVENLKQPYQHIDNPYRSYMTGRGAYLQKPILANIKDVELIGNNATLKIKENDWCNNGKTTDMAILHLFGDIDSLIIHDLVFDNNGLTMDETHIVSNHGICYKEANSQTESGLNGGFSFFENKICNLEIYNCTFMSGGTRKSVQDCGGDGVLIINPSGLSHDINIHDNKFLNWGRWCFAIDLGGNGERIYNVKFNNNLCKQDFKVNTNLNGYTRGLGWIDFEARKCFTNLEICNNYVDGVKGFAFNGNGKVSENITIKNNILTLTTEQKGQGGYSYPYTWNFYGVQTKNLLFENNDFSNAPASYKLGYTLNNIVIRDNKMPSSTDALPLNRMFGDIIIEGNRREDYGKLCDVSSNQLELPDYLTDKEKNNPFVNLIFRNNKGSIHGKFFDESKKGYYSYIKLTIENNEMANCNIEAFDAIDFKFNLNQIKNINTLYAFSIRGASAIGQTVVNYRKIPNGGAFWEQNQILCEITQQVNNTEVKKRLVCTKSGYIPMQGSFGLCENDNYILSYSNPDTILKKGQYIYTPTDLYIVQESGKFEGIIPTHKQGIEQVGQCKMLWLTNLGEYSTVTL